MTDAQEDNVVAETPPTIKKDWRFYTGVSLFALSWLTPLSAFLVPYLGLSTATAAVVTGALVVGGPEVMMLAAVALLGKETFQFLKAKALAVFKRSPRPASAPRYYFALTLMFGSTLVQWIGLYYPTLLANNASTLLHVRMLLDFIFLASIVIAGEQFWHKFRRIFVYEGES